MDWREGETVRTKVIAKSGRAGSNSYLELAPYGQNKEGLTIHSSWSDFRDAYSGQEVLDAYQAKIANPVGTQFATAKEFMFWSLILRLLR